MNCVARGGGSVLINTWHMVETRTPHTHTSLRLSFVRKVLDFRINGMLLATDKKIQIRRFVQELRCEDGSKHLTHTTDEL